MACVTVGQLQLTLWVELINPKRPHVLMTISWQCYLKQQQVIHSYHRANKELSNDTNILGGFCDKVTIAKTSLNEICRNNQSNNEMFGFEMAKCVLLKKIECEVTGNAACVLELYFLGHCSKARK